MFVRPLSFEREETDEVTAYPVEQLAILMEHYHKNGEALLKEIFVTCIHSEVSRIQGMDYVEAQIDSIRTSYYDSRTVCPMERYITSKSESSQSK